MEEAAEANSTMLRLIVEKGPREGETHDFQPHAAAVKIGRVARGNTLAFKDAGISTKHLLIEFNKCWLISDLDSSNGTILNGSTLPPLSPTQLSDGDVVKLGEYTSIKINIISIGGESRARRNPRRRAGNEAVPELKTGLGPVEEEGFDLGKPPTGKGRRKRGGVVKGESEEKVEVEVQPVINTRRTRSSAKAESSNLEPNEVSNQIGIRPQRGRARRKQPLPELAETDGDNAPPPPPPPSVCENAGENVVQIKEADGTGVSNLEVNEDHEMEVSGQVGDRPKRGGGKRKKALPKVAENLVSEDAGDKNEDDAGRSNLEQEEHDLQVKNVGVVPPTLPKQGRQMGTRRTRGSSSIDAECSNLEGNEYPEMELTSQVGDKPKQGGAKRNKPSSEVINNVVSEDDGVNVEEVPNLGSPHVSENASEKIVENEQTKEAAQASDAGKEDVGTSNLGGEEKGFDFEQPPDLEKMTLGDWFDYLEAYLPKQIIKETEEIIASMKQKADQVYEYKLKHKEDDRGKGKSAMA